jgi:hypothetical protein
MSLRSKKMKSLKPSTPVTPTKPLATGLDLLQALEPLLMEHVKVATNKNYAAWVLASLRHELETGSKKPQPSMMDYTYSPFSAPVQFGQVEAAIAGTAPIDDGLAWLEVEDEDRGGTFF